MKVLVLVLCTLLLGACKCQRQPGLDASVPATVASEVATGAISADAADELARDAQLARKRELAVSAAVDTLHAYLRALGSGQVAAAEEYWAYQRSPSVSEEAGLRSLKDLQALRIENGEPKSLNAEPVPDYLEVPVDLRASLVAGGTNRYRGWYRLRHNPVTSRWELTAASVLPVIR